MTDMAEKKQNLSVYDPASVPGAGDMRIGIVVAEWNPDVTGALLRGATDTLKKHGIKQNNLQVHYVPGSFELPSGASFLAGAGAVDAVICLGCIIQGETRHFEFIAQAVAQGITRVAIDYDLPVIFGVLTTDTHDQAAQRAGGKHGNKGDEAAITAIKMVALKKQLST